MKKNILKDSIDATDFISEHKSLIYAVAFYAAGLWLGTLLYKMNSEQMDVLLQEVTATKDFGMMPLLWHRLLMYLIVFVLIVSAGFCVISFPFMNIATVIGGFLIAVKLSYIYSNYHIKGIGYALALILPQATLFICIIIFALRISAELSKEMYHITKKSGINFNIELKSYLKKFAVFLLLMIVAAIINACTTYLFSRGVSL